MVFVCEECGGPLVRCGKDHTEDDFVERKEFLDPVTGICRGSKYCDEHVVVEVRKVCRNSPFFKSHVILVVFLVDFILLFCINPTDCRMGSTQRNLRRND